VDTGHRPRDSCGGHQRPAPRSASPAVRRGVWPSDWPNGPIATLRAFTRRPSRSLESPQDAGSSEDGRGGFRTCDLSRVKRGVRGGAASEIPANSNGTRRGEEVDIAARLAQYGHVWPNDWPNGERSVAWS
jgi:hypothetical protein